MSAESTSRQARSYRLEPLDESGFALGLSAVQCVLIGGGVVVGAFALTAGLPVLAAALAPAVGAGLSFGRAGGMQLWRWVPALVAWARGRASGRRSWRAPLPLLPAADGSAVPLPPVFDGLEVIELAWRGVRQVAAVRDRQRSTLCVVVPVAAPQFAMEEPGEQERLLAGWGDVLNGFATDRGSVVQVGWSDLAAPSGLREHRDWIEDLDPPQSEALDCYRDLLGDVAAEATAHEVVVWILVSAARSRPGRTVRSVDDRLAAAAVTGLDSLVRALRNAQLSPGEPLNRGELYRLLRRRIDPGETAPQSESGRGRSLSQRLGLAAPANAGPLAMEAEWSHVRVDAMYHRTYWVESWPRLPVGPSWLEPFLAGGGLIRTMTVAFQPVPTYQARRRIERDLVKLESDAEVRETKGRRIDARHRRATAGLLEREDELVAGFAEMGHIGLIGVAAGSEDALDEAGEIVEQLAREHGMALRALSGRHELGWAAALPLGLVGHGLLGG
jgi:hypothetical protein